MDEPEDIGTSLDEDGPDLGAPRTDDVEAAIRKTRRRAWLIGAGALLVVAVVGGVLLFGGSDADDASVDADEETTSSVDASATDDSDDGATDETETADPDDPDDDGNGADGDDSTGDPDDDPAFTDAGMVAYRVGTEVWVASQSGEDGRMVVQLPVGGYALSPDGTLLAVTDGLTETLSIIDVETGVPVVVGDALSAAPVWSPDSQWLLVERRTDANLREIAQIGRDGKSIASQMLGHNACVRQDGTGFAAIVREGEDTDEHMVALLGAEDRRVETTDRVVDFVSTDDALIYAAQSPNGRSRIRVMPSDGSAESVLVKPLNEPGVMAGYASLMLSPDGTVLSYAATGDDGYSRLFVVPLTGGPPKELSIRRDAYPLRWTSDGEYLLFVEGNAFQGEETHLMRVRPTGMGREVLVEGAGL